MITIESKIDKIERVDGNRSVSVYMDKIWMSMSRQELMRILTPSMRVKLTFVINNGNKPDYSKPLFTIMNEVLIEKTSTWGKDLFSGTKPHIHKNIGYEYRLNSGITPIEGVIESTEPIPFIIHDQYYTLDIAPLEDN